MIRPRNRRRTVAGVTLLELLVAIALMALLAAAVTYAFVAGLDIQRLQTRRQAEQDRTATLEQRVTRLLQAAKLTDDVDDGTTFFVGTLVADAGDLGCDQLTFTTTAPGIPLAVQGSGEDFEAQHLARGPVGGVAEVSLSTTPAGSDAGDQTGLFERVQRPSDGDPTQGGMESLLVPEVERIGFQFWDGQQWVDTWDTEIGERRLPAAVRVSYVSENASEDGAVRVFIVPIPASDVDAQNPAAGAGGGV